VGEAHAESPADLEVGGLALNDLAEQALDRLAEDGELDVLYERYSLWSVAGARAARRWGVPWFVEVNSPLVAEASRHRSLGLRSLASFLEQELLSQATRVIAVSDEVGRHVVDLGVDPDRVAVIPNGYNATLFRPRRERSIQASRADGERFTIAFVGSLRPWHGLDLLIEAFARLHSEQPNCQLLLVGDGPLRDEVRRRLRNAVPAESFYLTGAVPHPEVPSWLAQADVAVAPYPSIPDFYFSPLKVIEYCAMGLPIVASHVGQVASVLSHEETALLTEPGDVGELTNALRRLLDDSALRRRLGSAARSVARHRTWDSIASHVLQMFQDAKHSATAVLQGGAS
jgi:glycosyltransferase involved in cell wall biosynthesis